MSLSIIKTKRKVSCLICRVKKVKCDGAMPCIRCISRKSPEQCCYSKPGQVGRPPKNAVVNKLVLNRTSATSASLYKEFIFENVGYGLPLDPKFLNNDSTKNLYHFIDNFFSNGEAIMQIAIGRISRAIPSLPDIKMYDLLELYVWTTGEAVSVFTNRYSALTLDNYFFFDSIAAAVFQDMAFKFFSEPLPEPPIGSPLSTLSPQQAVHLIEAFFCISPHSLLLNKTLLLQGYWTDVIDPILLCVVYGTATYLSKLLNGQPVGLWEAVSPNLRNPFLDYAYSLIRKSSSKITLAKYQAVTLLGLFESTFGHIKRGMATLGLAYLIGEELGVINGAFQGKSNKIHAELANVTFWALFNSSVRGGIDLGHVPRFSRKELSIQLPPPSIEQSASYQFEEESGDARLFRDYYFLLESFYIQTVSCKFSSLLLQQFPEVAHSMFHSRSRSGFLEDGVMGHPEPDDLEPRMRSIIQEFYDFIQDKRGGWSKQVTYTLEVICAIHDIHVDFLKDIGPFIPGSDFANSTYDFLLATQLTPGNPLTMSRVDQAMAKIYSIMDKTQVFLSDPLNYNERPLLLPRGLMVTMLETCMEVLLLKCVSNPEDATAFDYLKMVETLAHECIWVDWTTIRTVRNKIKTFFANDNTGTTATATDLYSDDDTFIAAMDMGSTSSSGGGSQLSVDDQLARATFFDPCATWVTTPMTSLAMDLQLLDGLTGSPTATDPSHEYEKRSSLINNTNTTRLPENPMANVPDIMVDTHYDHSFGSSDEGMTTTPTLYSLSPTASPSDTTSGALYIPSDPSTLLDDPTINATATTPSDISIPVSTSPIIQQILFDGDPFV